MLAAATGSPPGAPAAMWKRPAPTDRHGVKPRRTPLGGGGRRRLRSSDAGTSSDVLGSSSARNRAASHSQLAPLVSFPPNALDSERPLSPL